MTVITAVRNGAEHLDATIESISNQTFRDFEYVIVDDASDDCTPEIVERHRRDDPRLRYIRRDVAGGPYAAANEGVAAARGAYVARIDGDDLALPHRLERQLTYLQQHPELAACASLVMITADGVLRDHGVGHLPMRPRTLKWRMCVRPGLVHSTAFVKRRALLEVGSYADGDIAQDLRLWCDMASRDWLGIIPEVLTYWRHHDGQITRLRRQAQFDAAAEIVRDHLMRLTGTPWPTREAETLLRVGLERVPFAEGTTAINTFRKLWRDDASLDDEDRAELAALTRRLRYEHAKHELWFQIDRSTVGRPLLRLWTRRRSLLR